MQTGKEKLVITGAEEQAWHFFREDIQTGCAVQPSPPTALRWSQPVVMARLGLVRTPLNTARQKLGAQ